MKGCMIQCGDLTVSHSSFLSVSATPTVDIVLPLSSIWQDKADKRWSHVSTSHGRREGGKEGKREGLPSCGSKEGKKNTDKTGVLTEQVTVAVEGKPD